VHAQRGYLIWKKEGKVANYNGGMEAKLRETKLKLENSGEMRHTLVLWNQIISAIFRVQAWETKLK
jgi:hypothetical protein